MKHYCNPPPVNENQCYDSQRIEAVTTCVGFDDILDVTLGQNHGHFDNYIVVTSSDDKKTQAVCKKHSATCVQSDLFKKNGRNFNKGAAINAGFNLFQYAGWRIHLDSDILLPDSFRRMILNHTYLDDKFIYGADRIDVVGMDAWNKLHSHLHCCPQHAHKCLVNHGTNSPISARYVDKLRGYVPIGYFQLWHAKSHKDYPFSLGSAAHDDVIFAAQWAERHRVLLPHVITYHLCGSIPVWGENWDGNRKQKRLK